MTENNVSVYNNGDGLVKGLGQSKAILLLMASPRVGYNEAYFCAVKMYLEELMLKLHIV